MAALPLPAPFVLGGAAMFPVGANMATPAVGQ